MDRAPMIRKTLWLILSTAQVATGPRRRPARSGQRNFTDPDSRIQPLRSKAVIAGYNAQIAVDGAHQIIAAQRLQTSLADARSLPGLLADIRTELHANPKEVSADAGYCDEQNLRHLVRRRIDGYIAPGRARHTQKHAAGSRRWPKRWIKQAKGFRQFLLRVLNKLRGEWAMICTIHNLLKLAKATG
jgi:Transposase DDE domain